MNILPFTLPSLCDFLSSNDINVMSDCPKKSGDLMTPEKGWCEVLDRLHEVGLSLTEKIYGV